MQRNAILVPGLGGSSLYNLNKKIWTPTYYTLTKSSSFIFTNRDYIHTKLGDPNGLVGKDWFTRYIIKDTYYDKFIKTINPHSFAYDFRLIHDPNYLNNLYSDYTNYLNQLNNKSVIYCYSLGGLLIHDYLSNKNSSWIKDKIDKIIYINTPFDGTLNVYKYIIEDHAKTFKLYKDIDLIGGLYWCLPWINDTEILYYNKTYTTKQIPNITRLKNEYYDFIYPKKINRLKEIDGIKSIIIYSNSSTKKTLSKLNLSNIKLSEYDQGDGTVLISSLTLPTYYWNNLETIVMQDTEHSSILQNDSFIKLCKEYLIN
jgi:hypothetical protein